ncbi:AraC family transcriptional regulator [Paenibacillus oralis]|uniref:AraC family transcriptional regulator n=1 Tax=Paenibacillus oralis TaxID=2490856 RepID=A0A3P3U2I4_9BACL|nr:helix-turn-helix domain-containing protein [Paenibacillus oralis]RRJ64552.1 AraC family transcriptional regulator [Paenibacillus oralis]
MSKTNFKKTIYNHLILSYTILSVILIGSMGGYWYAQVSRMMDQEIVKDNMARLQAAQNLIEQNLLKKYEDNLQNKALAIGFIQDNSNLNLLLYNGWEGNLSKVFAFNNDLQLFKVGNSGITNVSVYFPSNDYVIDADRFYMHTANAQEAPFFSKMNQIPLKKWIVRVNANDEQVLSYIIKLPYDTPIAKAKGYFVIDVDVHYLKSIISPMLSSKDDRLVILDESGAVLFQVGGENSEMTERLNEIVKASLSEERVIGEPGVPGIASRLASSHSDHKWTYIMYRPAYSFELFTERLKKELFTACGVIVIFGIFMSFLLSKRLYVPISDTFSMMREKIGILESRARKTEMINLLLGVSLRAEPKEISLPDTSYCVACIQLTKGDSEGLKQCYELSPALPGEFIALNANEAAIIYYLASGKVFDSSELVDDLKALQRIAGPRAAFQAAIGRQVQNFKDIPESYRTAQETKRYHFIFGKNTVIAYASTQALNADPLLFHFEHYSNALKAGDQRAVNEFMDHFLTALLNGEAQIEAVELAVLQLIAQLYQCVIELKLQHMLPSSNLTEELKQDTLHGTIESIRKMSAQITGRMNAGGNQPHAEVVRTMKEYIAEHLHEDLSLQILSREVALAPAYVSTLFSEGTKSSFTEYVTRLRLEKAAELLIANPRLSVSAIAEQVGYRNVQYFHSKFKARFGVTPVQYRRLQQGFKDLQTL